MSKYFCLLILWCFPLITQAQFCTGTLGDNIFFEGDFGSGIPNLLSPDPGIAPGYIYTFNVPPIDGQYVLTNNTGAWSGLFDTWLDLADNSDDPNGYMMVVNASNDPGIFYQQTVSGLCENTLYEFSADILNLIRIGVPDHLDPNVSFLLNGVAQFSTGNIPQTETWTSFGFTFSTSVGQESLTLSLRNNAPGGIGNDLALDNISFRACGPETSIENSIDPSSGNELDLCADDTPVELEATLTGNQYVNPSFQWQESFDEGLNWIDIAGATSITYTPPSMTVARTYYFRFLVADGVNNLDSENCRVNSDPKIINVHPIITTQIDTMLCEGVSIMIGNSTYDESGIYRDTIPSFFGCDSILITDLIVAENLDFMVDFTVLTPCPGEAEGSIAIENISGGAPPYTYVFEGMDLGTIDFFPNLLGGQTYSITIQDAGGCSFDRLVSIEGLAEITADFVIDPPCPNLIDGSITIENLSGGTPPYNIIFGGIGVGETTFFPELGGAQSYTFIIEDALGCSIERSVFIENPDEIMADLIVTVPCANSADGSISVENQSGGTPPYTYSFNGTEIGTTTFFQNLAGGITYTITIRDSLGCTAERMAFVEQPEDAILELGEDEVVELGESVQVSPFYNFTPIDFRWQINPPVDCLDFADCDAIDFIPTVSQQVMIELVVSEGCTVSDSIFIEVIDVRKVYLPNAFSPNGDGTNDFFTVFAGLPNVEVVEELQIFNRWGALIFENKNFLPNLSTNGWNGTFKGDPLRLGVYLYTAKVRFVDGQVLRYSGDVTIVQ